MPMPNLLRRSSRSPSPQQVYTENKKAINVSKVRNHNSLVDSENAVDLAAGRGLEKPKMIM